MCLHGENDAAKDKTDVTDVLSSHSCTFGLFDSFTEQLSLSGFVFLC